jgi:hypothetical protein
MSDTTMTARDQVLQAVPEADRLRVGGLAHYLCNRMGGRPSDGARRAVAIYEAGHLPRWEAERQEESNTLHRRECQFGPRACTRCASIDAEGGTA